MHLHFHIRCPVVIAEARIKASLPQISNFFLKIIVVLKMFSSLQCELFLKFIIQISNIRIYRFISEKPLPIFIYDALHGYIFFWFDLSSNSQNKFHRHQDLFPPKPLNKIKKIQRKTIFRLTHLDCAKDNHLKHTELFLKITLCIVLWTAILIHRSDKTEELSWTVYRRID